MRHRFPQSDYIPSFFLLVISVYGRILCMWIIVDGVDVEMDLLSICVNACCGFVMRLVDAGFQT